MPRSKNEPGKGGFWKLDLERLEEGKRTRRRSSSSRLHRMPTTIKTMTTMTTTTSTVVSPLVKKSCTALYETPPSSVSPPIPDCLPEVPESTQVSLTEDDLTGLLIATVGWDENQLDLLDSLLDSL